LSSTTSPRADSSSTTSPPPCVRLLRHVARLVTRLVVDYFASRRLIVDYFTYAARPVASARRAACHVTHRRLLLLASARHRLLRLRRTSGCLGTSCSLSHGSSSTTSSRAGSLSTTSPTPRVRLLRHVARLVAPLVVDYFASRRLVIDYFTYVVRPVASARRAACRETHRLLLRLARLVVDYFAYTTRPSASARRVARHAACRRLLRLWRASGCLYTSRGSSHGSSSTTSTTPRVRLLRHVTRHVAQLVALLIVDYFAYAARPGASACRVARLAARRRQLRLHRASGCLGMSRGSSHGSSSTTPCAATSSCSHTGSTSATPCVATTCLAATLGLHQLRRAPPRRHLLVASCWPFISTSFPN
jgi:hypothetical protein